MKSEHLISVVMPVYNGEMYLKEAVDSILSQSYSNWELIAVDDGSSDGSLTILNRYQAKDSRIKVVQNERNVGLPAALNIGLRNARGEFIARLDSDDISEAKRLESQYHYLLQHPGVGLVACNGWLIDEKGNEIKESEFPLQSEACLSMLLESRTPFTHGSWMFRRACMEQVGLYNELMFACEDKDLWLRISEQFEAVNLPGNLYQYRIHNESFTSKSIARKRFYRKLHVDLYRQRQRFETDILITRKGGLFDPARVPLSVKRSLAYVAKANEFVGSKKIGALFKYTSLAILSGWRTPYAWHLAGYLHVLFYSALVKSLRWHVNDILGRKNPPVGSMTLNP